MQHSQGLSGGTGIYGTIQPKLQDIWREREREMDGATRCPMNVLFLFPVLIVLIESLEGQSEAKGLRSEAGAATWIHLAGKESSDLPDSIRSRLWWLD